MRLLALLVVAVVGCGRIGFEQRATDPIDGAAPDIGQADGGFVGGSVVYIKASNTGSLDSFGGAIALSADGNTLAVGAYDEDSAATGIDGNGADNSALGSGAVYVFVRVNELWTQQAYIKASNTGASDVFGLSVGLAANGDTLVVSAVDEDSAAQTINGNQADNSASNAGAVYVFTRAGVTWTQQAYLKASNSEAGDQFGQCISLSADGNTLAVGSHSEDSDGVGLTADPANDAAAESGAVYIFTRTGSVWNQDAYIKASNTESGDYFGEFVALSADGLTLAVGAYMEDSAATGINGNQLDNSEDGTGAVYVFTRLPAWSQQAYVKASNANLGDEVGNSVALTADGNALVMSAHLEDSAAVGLNGNQLDNSATESGAIYVLDRVAGNWSQTLYIKPSNTGTFDVFGLRIAASSDGSTFAVGALGEGSSATGLNGDQLDNSAPNSGAVYVFDRGGQRAYVKAPNTAAGDQFHTPALSGNGAVLAVGAFREDSAAIGINGNQADNSAPDSGAVYVYQ